MSLPYRAEVDGLRAVAVLPVILFHAGFSLFSGGFVGVDVFFVISGFLITGIIRAELAQDRFSIIRFYERRARRLLPALFLVILCCLPFAWAWMLPDEFAAFGDSLWAVSLFGSNFLFWRTTGYFGTTAELIPLLHTWSLAVEEQFYLFFPLLLLLLRRLRAQWLTLLLVALCGISLALAEALLAIGRPSAAFFLLPSRAWELGIGALAAIWVHRTRTAPQPVAQGLGLAGLAMILVAIFLYDKSTPFPGYPALLPVIGTALVLLFAHSGTLAARLLSTGPMVAIGLISYSAYLWHQPLLAMARIRVGGEPAEWLLILLCLASLALAWISWKVVETPFRRRGGFSRPAIFALAAIGSAATIVIGIGLNRLDGVPSRVPEQAVALAKVFDERLDPAIRCVASPARQTPLVKACRHGGDAPLKAALWGDSHANSLAQALGNRFERLGIGMTEFSFSDCPPLPGIRTSQTDLACPARNDRVLAYLLASPDIETVVLAARWSFFFESTRFDNGEGGKEPGNPGHAMPLEASFPATDTAARQGALQATLATTVETLLASGKRVIVVGPVPEAGWVVPRHLARQVQFNPGFDIASTTTATARYESRSAAARAAIDGLPDHPRLIRIDPAETLCSPERCRLVEAGRPLYRDDDHLSAFGAEQVVQALFPEMAF